MLRALVQEVADLIESFFEGLGQVIAAGLGLLFVGSLAWLAWEILARLI